MKNNMEIMSHDSNKYLKQKLCLITIKIQNLKIMSPGNTKYTIQKLCLLIIKKKIEIMSHDKTNDMGIIFPDKKT